MQEVFVTEFKPNTASDRNMLQMYQLIERARRELLEAQENAKRDNIVAKSYAEQGEIQNLAPSILALQHSPVGKVLIERDAGLRELMVSAGINPGVNVTMQDPMAQEALGQPPATGYLNLPRPAPLLPPEQLPHQQYTTGAIGSLGSTPLPPPEQTFEESSTPVDEARQRMELSTLEQAGFRAGGRGQVVPIYDDAGRPIEGTKEWVLQVSTRRSNGYLMIVFHFLALPLLFALATRPVIETIVAHRQRSGDVMVSMKQVPQWLLWELPSVIALLFTIVCSMIPDPMTSFSVGGVVGLLVGLVAGFLLDQARPVKTEMLQSSLR